MNKTMLLLFATLPVCFTIQLRAQTKPFAGAAYQHDSLTSAVRKLLSLDSIEKEFVWPDVVRREMTENLDSNLTSILALKKRYAELVPSGYEAYIFFNHLAAGNVGETYDITIRRKGKTKGNSYSNLADLHSSRASKLINASLGWEHGTIMEIRKLLKDAHCSGIENSEATCIYYGREYRYLFFQNDLTPAQLKKFDDQKRFFFYGKNIVIDINKTSTESLPLRDPS